MTQNPRKVRHLHKHVGRNVFERPPRISVVITAFGESVDIGETVASALGQRYREHEVIVVGGGPGSPVNLERDLQRHFEDITFITGRHATVGNARNTGVENARGEFVAFLDGGDVWERDLLPRQYVFMQRGGYDVVYSDASITGTRSAYRRRFTDRHPSHGEANFLSLLDRRCNVLLSGAIARKSLIDEAGTFETEDVPKTDLHLWLRMAKRGAKFGYQKHPFVGRRHLTAEPADELERLEAEKAVYERISSSIDLTGRERAIVGRRIAGLEASIALKQGRVYLKSGDHSQAVTAFKQAHRFRPSLRNSVIAILSHFAPKTASRLAGSDRLPSW